jgi:hypothetical protein
VAEKVTVKADPESPGSVVLNRWPTEAEKDGDLAAVVEAARAAENGSPTPQAAETAQASAWAGYTVSELRDHAYDNGINLRGASRKVDIISAIEAGS